jgi:hypothetical protein
MNILYNSLFTSLLLCDEWNDFARHRQPLRVTASQGEQRSKYYLSIPYHYAIPILVFSGGSHWLVSESLFLVRITSVYHSVVRKSFLVSKGPLGLSIFRASEFQKAMDSYHSRETSEKH